MANINDIIFCPKIDFITIDERKIGLRFKMNLPIFASSIKLYPCFCPFLGQKSVGQVECVVALYPKNAKNEEITNFRKRR